MTWEQETLKKYAIDSYRLIKGKISFEAENELCNYKLHQTFL